MVATMSRRAAPYHHGDLAKALLTEAARVVETEGVPALTLRELARRLGVSHAAPAHYFPDKAALLAELAAEGFEELADELESGERRGRTPLARLRETGRGYVRFAIRKPGHYRVMFGPGAGDSTRPPRLVEAGTRAIEALRRVVVAALPPARARSPERVRDAAFLAWSSVHGAAMLILDGPVAPHFVAAPDDPAVRALVDRMTATVADTIADEE